MTRSATRPSALRRAGTLPALFLALLCALLWTPARADDAQDVLEKVRKKYESVSDATLKFSQEVRFPLAGINQRTEGKLLLKKSNKYRVELDGQTIVTDGQTVWSYAEATNQVLIDRFKLNERMLTPERLLTSAPDEYLPQIVGSERIGSAETVVLSLTPKDDGSSIRLLKIWVDDGTSLVKQVAVLDVNGKKTTYTVRDIDINTGLDDGRFVFEIPEGVEVVDLR
jgi:outer membrane lipoprotein carrier protein